MKISDFSKHIIEGLLGEQANKKIAAYAGSFRPPTVADYNVLLKAIEENPGLDQIHVFVGDAESEGLTQDDAVEIWKMFGNHFPRDLYVHKSPKSPVQDVYSLAKKYPTYDISWLFGARAGDNDDFKEIADRTKSVSTYDNLSIRPIIKDDVATERKAAAAANMGKEELEKYLPDNLSYKEVDEIYQMLKPKRLDEIIYDNSSKIIDKITEEGWEYEDIDGGLAHQAAVVAHLAGRRKKKLYTVGFEQDTTIVPPIQMVNVFWSNEGDGPRRDLIEGGTKQDAQDIIDAGEFNLMEVADHDLKKFGELLDKIAEEEYKYIPSDKLIDNKGLIRPHLVSKAKELDSNVFTITKNISGGGPFGDKQKHTSLTITMATPKTEPIKQYYIDNTDDQDVEDIIDAASLNEVVDSDLDNFARLLDKIVEGEFKFFHIEDAMKLHGSVVKDFLKKQAQKDDVPGYFTVAYYGRGKDSGIVVHFSDGASFPIGEASDEDIDDLKDAASLNEAENIPELVQLLDKISEGNHYYLPSRGISHEALELGHLRAMRDFDLDKPLFSYSWSGGEVIAKFSDDGKEYWISKATKQDKQDIVDAVKTFMTKIPLKLVKEALDEAVEFEYDPVHEMGHYEDIMKYMNGNGMKLEPYPEIKFIDDDEENAADLFGKTAYYDPNNHIVVLYTYGRHPKDILRSFAHELVHVHQNHENRLEGIQTTDTNADDYLEEIEREAYETGNIMFRQWCDQVKEGKKKNYGIDAYAAELARLRENIDKKAQKKHKGKSAPYGSAYEPVKEDTELKAVEVKINPFQIYCDINDTLTDGSELPQWTEDGIELWNYISKYDPILLSNDANVNNKIKWIKASIRNLKQYIFYNKDKKQDFAAPDTILIDNRSKTIDRWNQAGGMGILFTDAQDVIRQLQQLGL